MTPLRTPLRQFEYLNPKGAVFLSLIDTSNLEVILSKNGEENLFVKEAGWFLHDQENPSLEAKKWQTAAYSFDCDVLVVFGIGLGYHVLALEDWLSKKASRRVIVIEDNITVISRFLDSKNAEKFYQNPQMTLFYINDKEEGDEVFETISWYAFKKKMMLTALPSYLQRREETLLAIQSRLIVQKNDVGDVLDEFFRFGGSQLRNFSRNLFLWQNAVEGSSLFRKFRHVPAIIVAAGPSLDPILPRLKALSGKALIISGGSATNALIQGGVIPHFTATCDPNPMQYIRLRQAQPLQIPTFFRSRTLFEGMMNAFPPLLYLPGSDGYPFVEWVEKEAHIEGPALYGGHSVSNLLVELAWSLGSRPIIMVGYDLSYPNGSRYSKHLSESLGSKEKISLKKSKEGLVKAKGYHHDVTTEPKWILEGKWISDFQKRRPLLKLINTSEKGLFLDGVSCMSFDDAEHQFLKKRYTLESDIHLFLQEAKNISFNQEALQRIVEKASAGINEGKELLQKILHSQGSGENDELVHELESSFAFKNILYPFSKMHEKMAVLQERIDVTPFDEKRREEFRRNRFLERCEFLYEALRAHEEFLFSVTSWSPYRGINVHDALKYTPIPKSMPSPNLGGAL